MSTTVGEKAPEATSSPPEIVLGGVRVHAFRQPECVEHVLASIGDGRGGWIATANLDHLRRLRAPGPFRDAYSRADIVVADGMPLVWAARLQGTPLPERVPGSDLIHSLSRAAAAAGAPIYLLGGDPGTAESAAAELTRRYPGLRVAGTDCPPFGFERDEGHMQRIRGQLVEAAPKLVFVALGSPKQELLIDRLRDELPDAWWIGVGISFSFVSGDVKRAPRWVQRIGLEWLHRLVQEPRRLGRRYLVDGPPFVLRLLGGSVVARFRRRA